MQEPTTKVCEFCETEQALSNFKGDARTADGYSIYCRYCQEGIDPSSTDGELNPAFKAVLKCRGECGQWKPRDEFYADARSRTGRTPWCKECTKAYHKAWRQNADHHNKSRQPWTGTLIDEIKTILTSLYGHYDVGKLINEDVNVFKACASMFPDVKENRLRYAIAKVGEIAVKERSDA